MKTSPMKKIKAKNLTASLCSILDSLDYKTLSSGRALSYLEYLKGNYADEQTLVDPVFFPKFAEKILGFKIGSSIIPKKSVEASGEHPDFVPSDLHLHPFVFETKGTDSKDLIIHFPQVQDYIQTTGTEYGIILNLRELALISESSNEPIIDFSFPLENLYRDYKTYPRAIDIQPNTKRFINFVNKFSCQELDLAKKIGKIASAKPWTGDETLSLEELTQKIRESVSILHADVRSQRGKLLQALAYDTKRKEKIAAEIDAIAESIEPREPKRELSASSLNDMLQAKTGSLDERAVDAYLYRVAYFTMTRILLVRLWEDIGFIKQTLYDGGFEKWYEEFNREIERLLKYAFHLAGERYNWLFNRENNYTWYYPGDRALIDVLYEFSHFNLGKLNADVLGTIYEEYVDRVDRKNKGQYYTPREVVSFIWDRVGFNNDDAFFRFEDGKRKPRLILDSATGSGGFLVEAARRLREEATYNNQDLNDLLDIENAIISGLCGSEISAFSYYITEINLLIQLTPIIKRILEPKYLYHHPEFTLSVIHQDSLRLHNRDEKTFEGFPDELKKMDEVYELDRKHDIAGLEGQKRQVYDFIKDYRDFDYVCANPPYIGEKGHKELFRSTVELYPYWKEYYLGKMDYLYWFVILGLSKLKEGGRLGFITTSYWPTADGAAKLRKYILDNALILEIIDLGETKIFEGAPGQHNMIFTLEHCSDTQERSENRIRVARVKKEFEGKSAKEKLEKLLGHLEKHIEKESYTDEYIDVFPSPVKQGELNEDAWNFMRGDEADKILKKIEQNGVPLTDICHINQGIVSGADKVTDKNIRLLPQDVISHYYIKVGDGIFVLTAYELEALQLSQDEKSLIKPFYKNSDIDRYNINQDLANPLFIIYTTKDTDIEQYPGIKAHLEKVRPILENKRECREGKLPWFSLHWARDQQIFEGEKAVTSRRSQHNTFALENQKCFEQSDITIVGKRDGTNEATKYILGLLNSKVLDFWFEHKGKPKGQTREYYFTPLSTIPVRRINFDDPEEVKIYDRLVELVNNIIDMKKALAAYNQFFPKARLTRLQDSDPLPEISDEEIVKAFGSSSLRIIRTHPQVRYQPQNPQHFFVKSIKEAEDAQSIVITSKDKQKVTLTAPKALLAYLQRILSNYIGREWGQIINQVPIPTQPDLFDKRREETLSAVTNLRQKIKALQEEIDSIVFKLYGLNKEEQKVIMEATEV